MEWTLEDFWQDVESETEEARSLFLPSGYHPENDLPPRIIVLNIAQEEMGKLSRISNKLLITQSVAAVEERIRWLREGERRIITTVSVLRRLSEQWLKLPDTPAQFIDKKTEKN